MPGVVIFYSHINTRSSKVERHIIATTFFTLLWPCSLRLISTKIARLGLSFERNSGFGGKILSALTFSQLAICCKINSFAAKSVGRHSALSQPVPVPSCLFSQLYGAQPLLFYTFATFSYGLWECLDGLKTDSIHLP